MIAIHEQSRAKELYMEKHKVVSRGEWLAARLALLAVEKELPRQKEKREAIGANEPVEVGGHS